MKVLILMMILLIPQVYGYSYSKYVQNVKVTFHDTSMSYKTFNNISREYFKGLQAIHVYPHGQTRNCENHLGFYISNYYKRYKEKTIYLCDHSSDVLIHELAHHKNNMDGATYTNNHLIEYYVALIEISLRSL